MKVDEFSQQIRSLSIGKGDHFFAAYFNNEEDKYQFYQDHLDIGDALIIIDALMEQYNISPQALLNMNPDAPDFDIDKTLKDMKEMMRVLKEAKNKVDKK